MTITQVMNEIKTLNPQERAKVLDFLLEIEAAQKSRHADDRTVDEAADRVDGPARRFDAEAGAMNEPLFPIAFRWGIGHAWR